MRWIGLLALISMTLAGCASQPYGEMTVQAPTWHPGHSWSYAWETEFDLQSQTERENDWSTSEEDVVWTVLRNHTADGEPGWILQQTGEPTDLLGTDWGELLFVRHADLLPTSAWRLISTNCFDGCNAYLDRWEDLYDHTGSYLPFPVTTGDTWELGQWSQTYHAEALGRSAVKVGTQTVPTMKVQFENRQFDAQEEAARMEEYGATVYHYDVDLRETIDVEYSPDLKNVVKIVHELDVTFDVKVQWEDEEVWEDKGTASGQTTWWMTEYDLSIREPWTEDEVLELASGLPGTPESYPMMIGEGIDIDVVGPSHEINIHEDEVAVVSATIDHENATDYDLYYRIVGPQDWYYPSYYGSLDDFTQGDSVAFTPDQIGQYEVFFRAADKNSSALAGMASTEFMTVLEYSAQRPCGRNLPMMTDPCDAVTFPMVDYGLFATVFASYEDELGYLSGGRLVIQDPTGREHASKQLDNGKATIETELCCQAGTWSAHVEQPTTTGGSVSYTVRVERNTGGYYH